MALDDSGEAARAAETTREAPPVGLAPAAPKSDGTSNVAFFQGLNALPEQMRSTLGNFELMVKAVCADAFTRGFKAGHAAAKAESADETG